MIKFLINTHLHGDHTGRNANVGRMGVTIVARPQLHADVHRDSRQDCANGEEGDHARAGGGGENRPLYAELQTK